MAGSCGFVECDDIRVCVVRNGERVVTVVAGQGAFLSLLIQICGCFQDGGVWAHPGRRPGRAIHCNGFFRLPVPACSAPPGSRSHFHFYPLRGGFGVGSLSAEREFRCVWQISLLFVLSEL